MDVKFETHRMGLAAFLLCSGMPMAQWPLRRNAGERRCYFRFEEEAVCERLAQEFLTGEPQVPVHRLLDCLDRLKKLVAAELANA
jgi:hypothetical protein